MFCLEEIKEFLKELELKVNEENIKWAYETLLKETKVFVKIREFEETFEQDLYDDGCCCNEGCECANNCCECDCCEDGCDCEDGKCKCKCCCKK